MSASERFGTADFANIDDLINANLIDNNHLFLGYTKENSPRRIGFDSDTGILVIGSAGSGKLTTLLAYQLLADETQIILDPKGELACSVAMLLTNCDCYFFNPYQIGADEPWFLPQHHRFNLLAFADKDSPTFFEDMMLIAQSLINKPKGGNGNSEHFYGKAVQVTANLLMYIKEFNPDATLPDLYHLVNDVRSGGAQDYFAQFHYPRMQSSMFAAVQYVAEELIAKREMAPSEFESIMSTISNSLQVLGSPQVQLALSNPATVSTRALCEVGFRHKKLFIMIPSQYLATCSPVLRCFFTVMEIEQQRCLQQRIHFIIDEAGQLGSFGLVTRIYSYGRGSKNKISTYYQNYGQIVHFFGQDDADTMIGNAQVKLFIGLSSEHSANFISKHLGKATYQYLSKRTQQEAAFKQGQAFINAIKSGDFSTNMMEIIAQEVAMHRPENVSRNLMNPDELMHLPNDTGILDIHGIGIKPYQYLKVPYFENPALAHRFLPNPHHPPYDRISVPFMGRWSRQIKIRSEAVPDALSSIPQYSQGKWSYPKGFRPPMPKLTGEPIRH